MTDDAPKPCIWTGSDTRRAVRGRHGDDCEGGACRGCQPCDERHCVVCGIIHVDEQTCPRCIGSARSDLRSIVELDQALPDQAAHHSRDGRPEIDAVMGGDAMAAMVSATTRGAHMPGDPLGAEAFLASWEDDWRHRFQHGPAGPASVRSAAWYLDRHLHHAAQKHPAFDEFAAELPRIVASLERILHAGEPDDTTAAACFRDGCGGQLVRKVRPRSGTGRREGLPGEGRSAEYECRRCAWRYDEAHYWLAVKQAYEAAAEKEVDA